MKLKSSCSGFLLVVLATVAAPRAAQPPPSDAKATAGGVTFRHYCRSCHGPEAKGDGPVAQYLTPKPADLTRIAERNGGEFPFEAVATAITGGKAIKGHGTSEMPVWGVAFKEIHAGQSEQEVKERIDQLVTYLSTIQVKSAPPS